ncbi:unnamed protein product, partial [Phaeothamnion confervicola]
KTRATHVAAAGAWILRLIKEWRYRSDIHKLHAMSDRQLSDIGLSRSRIEEAVRGGLRDETQPTSKLRTVFRP